MQVELLRTKAGWVISPDWKDGYSGSTWAQMTNPNGWGGKVDDPAHKKVKAFIKGTGWGNYPVLETRTIEALPKDYTLGQVNEMDVRYGRQVTTTLVERVFWGATIMVGTEIGLATSLARLCDADLQRFQDTFGIPWRRYLEYFSTLFGSPSFDLLEFEVWCKKEQGYVEDGKTSLQDFMIGKWGADTVAWFKDKILNDPEVVSA